MPSSTGMRRSISTTSGASSAAWRSASSPLPASPTTSTSSRTAEQRRQRLAEQRLVVDEQHPHPRHPGTSIVSVQPSSGADSTSQPAAEVRGPLPQPQQAEARRLPVADARPVVADLDADRGVGVVQQQVGARWRGRACGRSSGPPGRPGTAPPGPRPAAAAPCPDTASRVGTPAAEVSSASACSASGSGAVGARLAQGAPPTGAPRPARPRPAAAPWRARRRPSPGRSAAPPARP